MLYKTNIEELSEGMKVFHTLKLEIGIITKINIGNAIHVNKVYQDEYYEQFDQGNTGEKDIWYGNVCPYTVGNVLKCAQHLKLQSMNRFNKLSRIEDILNEKD